MAIPKPNPSLEDLSDIMPDVASSLREVLDYDGNVAEDLVLTFQVSFEEYGKVHTADLTAGNLDTPKIKKVMTKFKFFNKAELLMENGF